MLKAYYVKRLSKPTSIQIPPFIDANFLEEVLEEAVIHTKSMGEASCN